MGDISTHVIFHDAYWHLVFNDNGVWRDTGSFFDVCEVGKEEKIQILSEIKQ